ncbi:MAG: hypothetical protein ACRC46_04150 [Thermoguttaceae bacterium]
MSIYDGGHQKFLGNVNNCSTTKKIKTGDHNMQSVGNYIHIIAIVFFYVMLSEFTRGNENQSDISPSIISQEIEPFIDNDTALICYVDICSLLEVSDFSSLAEELARPKELDRGLRNTLSLIKVAFDNMKTYSQGKDALESLLKNDITHIYIVLNMKDLKFGPYIVVPNVKESSDKSRAVKQFMGISETNGQEANCWVVYSRDAMIIAGHPMLSMLHMCYHPLIDQTYLLFFPSYIKTLNGFYGLTAEQKKEYIHNRFETFLSVKSDDFQQAIASLEGANFVKAVFLFPDSVVAWELSHLKNMGDPVNGVSFDFLKKSRSYATFSIDTTEPQVQLVIKSKPDKINQLKIIMDRVYEEIYDNYVEHIESKSILEFELGTDGSWTKKQKIALLLELLPKVDGDKLVLTINNDYARNCWPTIIKNALSATLETTTDSKQ